MLQSKPIQGISPILFLKHPHLVDAHSVTTITDSSIHPSHEVKSTKIAYVEESVRYSSAPVRGYRLLSD